MISYSENYEDVYLYRCFKKKLNDVFFIDIGACHPVFCNVSYLFYENGSRGINIEPIAFRYHELIRARPEDVNINIGIDRLKSVKTINMVANADHLSSFKAIDEDLLRTHSANIYEQAATTDTLENICNKYVTKELDFLKIDTEGSEKEVIEGGNWNKYRPSIICIESVIPGTKKLSKTTSDIKNILSRYDYIEVLFDGVNKFYLSRESLDLKCHFDYPIEKENWIQYHTLGESFSDNRHPDHQFSKNLSLRLLNSISIENNEHLLKIFTFDLFEEELKKQITPYTINLAFSRVLGRRANYQEIKDCNKSSRTLLSLIDSLISSNEFILKRARCSSFSIHRN